MSRHPRQNRSKRQPNPEAIRRIPNVVGAAPDITNVFHIGTLIEALTPYRDYPEVEREIEHLVTTRGRLSPSQTRQAAKLAEAA